MRDALRGITTRGRCFLAAAVAAALSAFVLGEKDLLRVAVLLALLPLLAAWYVGRNRHRLSCDRRVDPARVPVGATATVRLRLRNRSRLVTGTLLLEDRLPYALGVRPRLVLERLAGHRAGAVSYTVRAGVRGRHEIGPLLVRLTDPFGLCEVTRAFPGVERLTVTPELVPLPALRLTGGSTGTGDSSLARSVAVHGEDDAATREYRHGDDLRRVHWRSTARVGELMVRREEQPWESLTTVVLDTRARAHHGEGPTASFEWAVTAVASIAVHLRQCGHRVRLVSPTFDTTSVDHYGDGVLLDQLAQVRADSHTDLATLVQRVRARAAGGLLIGVFGRLAPAEAETLAGLGATGVGRVAFLLDTAGWHHRPDGEERPGQDHRAATGRLLAGGWRVIGVNRGDQLPALWPGVAGGRQPAHRVPVGTVSGGHR